MMKLRTLAAMAALPALLSSPTAHAAPATGVAAERPLEAAHGAPPRVYRAVRADATPTAARAWQRFAAANGAWRSLWDADTGVPLRLWGAGVAVPGALASPQIAEAAARRTLAAHLDLLAPGAAVGDFELVSNVVHGKGTMRTVGFVQRHQGLRVVGGQVSFLFKHDRLFVIGSEALPHVATAPAASLAAPAPALLQRRAQGWIEQLYGTRATAGAAGERVILPIVRGRKAGGVEYRVVRAVDVASARPVGRWDVYVDAATGEPVARVQKLRFGRGTINYQTPERRPTGTRRAYPAMFTTFTVNGADAPSNAAGVVEWAGTAAAQVVTRLVGPLARVIDMTTGDEGAPATTNLTVANNGTATWAQAADEHVDAQLTAYIHTNIVKAYARANLAPDLAFLDRQQKVFVNETEHCNAFSNGDDEIHFFSAGSVEIGGGQMINCENTGRIPDVVYHEFGHSLHGNSIIPGAGAFDGALSEGVSDYLAVTIIGDPVMGRGFETDNDNPVRDLDPAGREKRYPQDLTGEPHDDGEIIGGTLWDLRKAMIAKFGAADGVRRTDDIYYALLQRAADLPSTFVEALAQDDDDGNLDNGTPNQCLILEVFASHGLDLAHGVPYGIRVGAPERDGLRVQIAAASFDTGCPASSTVAGATLSWKPRGATDATAIPMTESGGVYSATLPTQPDGSVVQYQVSLAFSGERSITFPDNPADPFYELYVGPVEPIYCTDFEAEPTTWTHGASAGADEWQWGTPAGVGGDPTAAASGTHVFGIDLGAGGGNGTYEPDGAAFATTPEIDVSAFQHVRLQYKRWLGVEDAFFDHATIEADGSKVWENFATTENEPYSINHVDREWRFQDVDLSAAAGDGKVQLTFRLESDGGLEFGGWNLDDVCIVGVRGAAAPVCGNHQVEAGEQCDDGNTTAGDGCSATCEQEAAPMPDGGMGGGGTDDGGCCSTSRTSGTSGIALALVTGLALWRRRRRAQ